MKKFMPAMSVMLAIALVFASVPAAWAAEIAMQGSGAVQQAVRDGNLPAGAVFASVYDGNGEWAGPGGLPIGAQLDVFADAAGDLLKPGSKGSYDFWLENKTAGTSEGATLLAYIFEFKVKDGTTALPIRYTINRTGPDAANTGPAVGSPGGGPLTYAETELPANGLVKFTLTWEWDFDDGTNPTGADPLGFKAAGILSDGTAGYSDDNPIGVQSEDSFKTTEKRSTYEVELKFLILETREREADRMVTLVWKDAVTGEVYDTWHVRPGMTVAEAMKEYGYTMPHPSKFGQTFIGFLDENGKLIDENYVIAKDTVGEVTLIVYANWKKYDWNKWLLGGGIAIGGGGVIIGGLMIPWLFALPALPVICVAGWLLHRHCHKACGKPGCPACTCGGLKCTCNDQSPDSKKVPGYVPPPKTGESWMLPLLAGAFGLLAAGMLVKISKRKEEA